MNELRMEGDLKEKFIYLYIAKGEDRLRIPGCFEERYKEPCKGCIVLGLRCMMFSPSL